MPNTQTLSSFALRLLVLLPLLGAALPSQAAEPASDRQLIESLQQEVRELRKRVERLEAERERPAPAPVAQPAPPSEPVPGGWRTASNWGLLQKGQTDEEVAGILGEPDNRRSVRKFELWEYGDGIVRFYLRRLKSWEMPQGVAGSTGRAE
jgi:hypothetical protein